jgi:hypothetical protein
VGGSGWRRRPREINSPIAFSIKTPPGTLRSVAFFLASEAAAIESSSLVMSRNTFGCVRGADYCGVCSFFPPRRRRAELCAVSHLPVCLFINNCIAHIFICTSEKRRQERKQRRERGLILASEVGIEKLLFRQTRVVFAQSLLCCIMDFPI